MKRMQKAIVFILMLFYAFAISACSKKATEEKLFEVVNEQLVYDISGENAYTVDENGLLYTFDTENILNEEDEIIGINPVLSVYDLEGELTEQYILDKDLELSSPLGIIRNAAIRDGVLYIVMENQGLQELYSYDPINKKEEKLYTFKGYTKIENLIPVDGKVYFIGNDINEQGKEYKGTDKAENYSYDGEVFGYIDVNEKTKEVVSVDFPISISATLGDSIMVYAYDDDEGYYFAEYNIKNGEYEILKYADYGNNLVFSIIDKENHFLYLNRQTGITCASTDINEGEAAVVSKYTGNKVVYIGGQMFYTNVERKLSRMSLEGNIKWNQPIKAIYSEYIYRNPFGCGYAVMTETLEADVFALRVLAQDKDFDVCLLDSSKDVAANIKKNGIFYPLNEVEGVKEYLDACFPYIKEVALTDKGEVWMIPVYLEADVFVYNKKVFEEYGITTDMVAEFDGFTEITDRFAKETDLRMNVQYAGLKNALMDQYLSRYSSLDTPLFRNVAELLSNRCNKEQFGYLDNNLLSDIRRGTDKFLYSQNLTSAIFSSLSDATGYGIIPMPSIGEGIKNQATCIMMSVNPNSGNLENTLNYISEYAKYMLEQRNSFLLSDISTYDDTIICRELYECYADAEITFRIDSEIVQNNLYNYLGGEITLEECIEESDRKLKVYLNE